MITITVITGKEYLRQEKKMKKVLSEKKSKNNDDHNKVKVRDKSKS